MVTGMRSKRSKSASGRKTKWRRKKAADQEEVGKTARSDAQFWEEYT